MVTDKAQKQSSGDVLQKKVLLEFSQISQENNGSRVSFLIVAGLKKEFHVFL